MASRKTVIPKANCVNHHKTRLVKHNQTSFIILVYEAFPTHFYIFTTRFCRRHAP